MQFVKKNTGLDAAAAASGRSGKKVLENQPVTTPGDPFSFTGEVIERPGSGGGKAGKPHQVEKSEMRFIDNWNQPLPEQPMESLVKAVDKGLPQANLNRNFYNYQYRIHYPKILMKYMGEERSMGWTEEEIAKMEKADRDDDPKYRNFIKW